MKRYIKIIKICIVIIMWVIFLNAMLTISMPLLSEYARSEGGSIDTMILRLMEFYTLAIPLFGGAVYIITPLVIVTIAVFSNED